MRRAGVGGDGLRIRQEVKEQIRAALVQAGTELIEAQGLEATTVEEITRRAGVAKGTFYNYFKTKDDLVYAAVQAAAQGWEEELEHILAEHPTTFQRLLAVFDRILRWVEQHPELNWIWLMEGLRRIREPERQHSPFREILRRIFAAGQAAGEIRTDRSPEDFAVDLSGLYLVHAARAYFLRQPRLLRETLVQALEVYLYGAAAASATAPAPPAVHGSRPVKTAAVKPARPGASDGKPTTGTAAAREED